MAIIILIGFAGSFVSVLVKKISTKPETKELEQIIIKANFTEIARENITLPITWEYANTGKHDSGMGVKFYTVKRAFPHGKTIRVTLAGEAFILVDDTVKKSDAEMRISLEVAPMHRKLTVVGIEIDRLDVFDFSDEHKSRLLANKQNILTVLERNISSSLLEFPIEASEIYKMTHDQIVLWAK